MNFHRRVSGNYTLDKKTQIVSIVIEWSDSKGVKTSSRSLNNNVVQHLFVRQLCHKSFYVSIIYVSDSLVFRGSRNTHSCKPTLKATLFRRTFTLLQCLFPKSLDRPIFSLNRVVSLSRLQHSPIYSSVSVTLAISTEHHISRQVEIQVLFILRK